MTGICYHLARLNHCMNSQKMYRLHQNQCYQVAKVIFEHFVLERRGLVQLSFITSSPVGKHGV